MLEPEISKLFRGLSRSGSFPNDLNHLNFLKELDQEIFRVEEEPVIVSAAFPGCLERMQGIQIAHQITTLKQSLSSL